ncbi:helix-turn-helix domain-containing protein [Thalassorhabdus alkalitolerans]|uniref:Helix-turn-helix domain-containing protein n=1 Tax=Thalassorhabdus alkalitolerans TaxID=2282697 RepID=A0ABW0YQY0_9BACI
MEIPEGKVLVDQAKLKEAIQELLVEVWEENDHQELLTIQEAANYLKISVPTVRKLIAKNEIPYFKKGQVIRLNRWDLKKWIKFNSL